MCEVVPDMLDRYHSEENMSAEEGWCCGECGKVTAAVKKLEVKDAPELLIVHLKRFTYSDGRMHKVDTDVGVPTNMDVAGESYGLSAMVKHSGSKHSGHYVANISTEHGWLLLDDHRVGKTAVGVFSWCPLAYILMYEKLQKSFPVPDASHRRGPATSMSQGIGAETRRGSF